MLPIPLSTKLLSPRKLQVAGVFQCFAFIDYIVFSFVWYLELRFYGKNRGQAVEFEVFLN